MNFFQRILFCIWFTITLLFWGFVGIMCCAPAGGPDRTGWELVWAIQAFVTVLLGMPFLLFADPKK